LGKKIILLFLLSYIFYIFFYIGTHKKDYQWDFKAYYFASKAHSLGLNPYGLKNLSKIAKEKIRFRFIYPPITLWFFKIFSQFNYYQSFFLFLFFKLCLLISILLLWRKEFIKTDNHLFFYLFCLLAFNSTIYLDILAGNISIIEQFFLWFGFYFLLKDRLLIFCIFIAIASIFKILPIVFLLLILISKRHDKYYYLFSAGVAFFGVLMLSYFLEPHLFEDFIYFARQSFEARGLINPSTFTFVNDIFSPLSKKIDYNIYSMILIITYLIIMSLIIGISLKSYYLLKNSMYKSKNKIVIFLFCLVYVLILPRFKDYSYILLIVPTYYLIENLKLKRGNYFLFIICILSTPYNVDLPGLKTIFHYLWTYYPLVIAYMIWILYVIWISKLKNSNLYRDDVLLS